VRFPAWLCCSVLLPVLACEPASVPSRHILLITVDTLRADYLGEYGHPLGLTPEIDRLAAQGVLFERAYAPASYTLPSIAALLTGRYPEEIGIRANPHKLADDVPTLASILQEHGWGPGAVVGNIVLTRASGIDRGFERYDDRLPQAEPVRGAPERIAAATTDAALDMLDQFRAGDAEHILLWVHYQDPHGPYVPPPGYRERYLAAERAAPDGQRRLPASANYLGSGAIPDYQLLGGNREVAFYRAGYAGEVRYMDGEVGRLLAGLDRRGLGDETVVVFTADHGEALGDSDFWFAHGEYLIESLVRVPLVIRVPGRRTSRRADIASLLDVVPTLAGLFDFPAPEGARGRDLLSDRADGEHSDVYMALPLHTTRPRFGLVADGHQYLLTLWGVQEQEQLFRLGQPEQDLAQVDRGRLREMGQRLATMRAGMADTRESQTQQLSPEARRRLKALGYVGP